MVFQTVYCYVTFYLRSSIFNFCSSVCYRDIVDVSALKIHMSKNAYDAVTAFPEFITVPRGDISIKVKEYHEKKPVVCKLCAKYSIATRMLLICIIFIGEWVMKNIDMIQIL